MDSSLPAPTQPLLDAIARSAASFDDLHSLRFSLGLLSSFEDPRARFARALFELSLARRGEPEARENLTAISDELLISWRDGNGTEFARLAPVLEELWTEAATLMVSFEVHRFNQALELCANARGDAERLSEAIEKLLPEGNRAVEFARCLYHLELARLGVDASRAEFARRAGLLAEAYQSVDAAKQLIGNDEGLAQLWSDVLPYLDEFFEMMEEEAARRQRGPTPSRPPPARASGSGLRPAIAVPTAEVPSAPPTAPENTQPAVAVVTEELPAPAAVSVAVPTPEVVPEAVAMPAPAFSQPEPAVTVPEYQAPPVPEPMATAPIAEPPPEATELPPIVSSPSRPGVPLAPPKLAPPVLGPPVLGPPVLAPPVLEPTPLGEGADVPSFRTLLKRAAEKEALARGDAGPPRLVPVDASEEAEVVEAAETAEPAELDINDEDIVEVASPMALGGPPPPPVTAEQPVLRPPAPPPPTLIPPPPPSAPLPPPPPALTGPVQTSALDAVVEDDYVADAPTLEFWRHAFTELELVPPAGQPRSPDRRLSADGRNERKRLTQFLESLGPHIEVPEARAFSCLIRLMAAGQLKEKTLFGGANARRAEAFADAFAYLSTEPMAAAHGAEFFVLDGLETELSLRRGLAVLTDFVFWCGANQKDPLDFDVQNEFAERLKKR